jgi:O-antigen/teichoic acid export membrane protein
VGRLFVTVVGYALNLIVLAGLSLALIPLLIGQVGAEGWGSVALGQSVGVFAAVVIDLGWSFHGAAAVARFGDRTAGLAREAKEALVARATTAPAIVALTVGLVLLMHPHSVPLALAGVASMVFLGFRMNWLFIGLRSPRLLFAFETLPRVIGLAAAVLVLVVSDGAAVAALLVQAGGVALGCAVPVIWVTSRTPSVPPIGWADVPNVIRRRLTGLSGQVISAGWAALPTIAVAGVSSASLPSFALASRVMSQATTAVSPVIDVFQGWVPRAGVVETQRRARVALLVTAVLAFAGVGIYFLIATPLFEFLGGGVLRPSSLEVQLVGAIVALTLISNLINLALLSALHGGAVFVRNTALAVSLGVILLFPLTAVYGGTGAFVAVLAAVAAQLGLAAPPILRRAADVASEAERLH